MNALVKNHANPVIPHDPTRPWRYGLTANPILARGTDGQWDDCGIWPGSVVRVGKTWYLHYEGRSCGEFQAQADRRATGRGRAAFSQVGLATLQADTFFFRPCGTSPQKPQGVGRRSPRTGISDARPGKPRPTAKSPVTRKLRALGGQPPRMTAAADRRIGPGGGVQGTKDRKRTQPTAKSPTTGRAQSGTDCPSSSPAS